jgi:hypothetical protein
VPAPLSLMLETVRVEDAATTLNAPLTPLSRTSPLTRFACSTTPFSAGLYSTPLMVIVSVALGIVPVRVPESVPLPVETVRLMPVGSKTGVGSPSSSCASTTTLNGTATPGFVPPLTLVMASFDAAARLPGCPMTQFPMNVAGPLADTLLVTVFTLPKCVKVNVPES